MDLSERPTEKNTASDPEFAGAVCVELRARRRANCRSFWDGVLQGLNQTLPELGRWIDASGKVELYRNALQLKVSSARDLRLLSESEPHRQEALE